MKQKEFSGIENTDPGHGCAVEIGKVVFVASDEVVHAGGNGRGKDATILVYQYDVSWDETAICIADKLSLCKQCLKP